MEDHLFAQSDGCWVGDQLGFLATTDMKGRNCGRAETAMRAVAVAAFAKVRNLGSDLAALWKVCS